MFDDCYRVEHIPSLVGKEFVKLHHYSHGIHNGPTCYGLFTADELVGVLAIATPCSENVRRSVFGPGSENSVTELHRLVLLDKVPKNGESFFIARALKLHKQRNKHIHAILSFADSTEGHIGTIYQATNALYTGKSGKAKFYLDLDGRLRHPRQNGVNITENMAKERGWKSVLREGKHRYLYLLADSKQHRKKLLRALKLKTLSYPR